jgi:hypothetical protein
VPYLLCANDGIASRICQVYSWEISSWTSIAGVAEEALGIVVGDGGQRRPEGCVQALARACRRLAQDALHLGPGRLNPVDGFPSRSGPRGGSGRASGGEDKVRKPEPLRSARTAWVLWAARLSMTRTASGLARRSSGSSTCSTPGSSPRAGSGVKHGAVGGSRDAHGGDR